MDEEIWLLAEDLMKAEKLNGVLCRVAGLNIEQKEQLIIALTAFARIQWNLIENHWGQSIKDGLNDHNRRAA